MPTTSSARLKGRHILITGAASGIGLATARKMQEEGATLALLDRDSVGLERIAADLGCWAMPVDLQDEAAVVAAVAEAAKAMGAIDGVANVAGIGDVARVEEMTLSAWQRVLAVNLTGPFLITRETVPHLRRAAQATIVNVSSGQGLIPSVPNMSSYCASKGGLITFSKAMAMELAPTIRVNAVCPGVVLTPLVPPTMIEAARQPGSPYALKRIADPEEIADAIVFLTSSEASFITGIALAIDGGRTYH